jgi:hypothetical protein
MRKMLAGLSLMAALSLTSGCGGASKVPVADVRDSGCITYGPPNETVLKAAQRTDDPGLKRELAVLDASMGGACDTPPH